MWRKVQGYHSLYRNTGFYRFMLQNMVKLSYLLVFFAGIGLLIEHFTPGIDYYFAQFADVVSREIVFISFFVSEAILGLIPPDLFIIWARQFSAPFAVVGLLALLSYAGGLVSYLIGMKLVQLPKVYNYVNGKFAAQFAMLKKWGGVLIVLAALFPLPFSVACMGAGILNYNLKNVVLLGLFRILRFFVYALIIFSMI